MDRDKMKCGRYEEMNRTGSELTDSREKREKGKKRGSGDEGLEERFYPEQAPLYKRK